MESKDWVKFSKEIFDFLNKVRQNPKVIVPQLEKSLDKFDQKYLKSADGMTNFLT